MEAIKDIIPNAFDNVNLNRDYLNNFQNTNSLNKNYTKEIELNNKKAAKNTIVKSENVIYVITI